VTPPQPPLTFRSGVDLIDVDVFVTDKDGRVVRDLTQDDFEIVEDGKPQAIRTFSFVDLPFARSAPSPADEAGAPEPDVTTNTTVPGRVWVILMDAPSTAAPPQWRSGLAYDAYAKIVARQFIEEAVTPAPPSMRQGFASSIGSRCRRAATSFASWPTSRAVRSAPSSFPWTCRRSARPCR
jgi:VWFA-related protein